VSDPHAALRAAYEAFDRGDIPGTVAHFHPEIVAYDAPELPGGATYYGREEVGGVLRDLHDMFDAPQVELLELIPAGDCVLAVARVRGRGQAGGVPIDITIGHLWTVRDGAIVELRVFLDVAAAREAAGLQPE
jgi:ketosteroid isomerase-like protein